jgi:hypothetical protein
LTLKRKPHADPLQALAGAGVSHPGLLSGLVGCRSYSFNELTESAGEMGSYQPKDKTSVSTPDNEQQSDVQKLL